MEEELDVEDAEQETEEVLEEEPEDEAEDNCTKYNLRGEGLYIFLPVSCVFGCNQLQNKDSMRRLAQNCTFIFIYSPGLY